MESTQKHGMGFFIEGRRRHQLSLLLVSSSEIDNMFFFTKEGFFPPSITIVTELVNYNTTESQTPVPVPSSFWLLCIPCLINCVTLIYQKNR